MAEPAAARPPQGHTARVYQKASHCNDRAPGARLLDGRPTQENQPPRQRDMPPHDGAADLASRRAEIDGCSRLAAGDGSRCLQGDARRTRPTPAGPAPRQQRNRRHRRPGRCRERRSPFRATDATSSIMDTGRSHRNRCPGWSGSRRLETMIRRGGRVGAARDELSDRNHEDERPGASGDRAEADAASGSSEGASSGAFAGRP